MKKYIPAFIFMMTLSSLFAQNSDLIFKSNTIAEIRITIDQSKLDWVYQSQNVDSDSLHLCSMSFQNENIDIAFDSVGFRLRGNTSRNGYKKPFKLDLNEYVRGQNINGVEKFNLRAEANDPSMIRSKFCADLMEKIGIPTSRVNYTKVYINDNYMGLYEIIEHVDENFLSYHYGNNDGNLYKCVWPADLNYHGPDPLYHPEATWDPRRPYELKTNEEENDNSELAKLIDVINNASISPLKDSLEATIMITDVIKYFAVNIMTGSWDDYRYLRNNYYLYHDPVIDKFRFIPYDYDNTFGIDWVQSNAWGDPNWARINMYSYIYNDNAGRPLSDLIFDDDEYRNLFTHFIDFYTNNVFRLDQWQSYGDSIKAAIRPDVALDTFYSYTMTDFDDSYDTNYRNGHVERGLYEFMSKRLESTNQQKNWRTAPASIYHQELVQTGRDAKIEASIFHPDGISTVLLKTYNNNLSSVATYTMESDPVSGTMLVEEHDRWIKELSLSSNETHYVIIAYDAAGTNRTWPRSGYAKFENESDSDLALYINEFMAANDATLADDANEYDDWLEIYNASSEAIDLSGMFLTDNSDNLDKWDFPEGTVINANDFLLVWCDEDGDTPQSGLHANFRLSIGGEFIALIDVDTISVIDHISYGPQQTDVSYGRETDGGGDWIYYNSPTPGYSNSDTSKDPLIPLSNVLYPNYPNPFNPRTAISYQLSADSKIELCIYNAIGQKVSTLVNTMQQTGVYKIDWNASKFPSGIYLAVLKINDNVFDTQKMILVK